MKRTAANEVNCVHDTQVRVGGFGYARHLDDSSLRAGIRFFAQGGAGNVFLNIVTAFGTCDDSSVLLRIAKLTLGIAGASLIYADIQEKFVLNISFFNAPDPTHSFFGFELDGVHDAAFQSELGAIMMSRRWLENSRNGPRATVI